jgi:dTDP-4-amino-4,6-dideoxygalactose transaminase
LIPLFANREAIEAHLPEILERQAAVCRSGKYVLGPELAEFEREFAAAEGREHCVGVANGTDAITIALRARGIGPGDEVVMPAYTFFATAEGVVNAGATPVFCDIDPATQCMTAATASAAITARTRALVPVHIFGNPAPMDELAELAAERDLALVADAAQAAGARIGDAPAGSCGDAATFSFYPGKNLGAFGDAGAIVTDDAALAETARRLRHHGTSGPWVHSEVGFNSRLDDIQATTLRVLLRALGDWHAARRRAAADYVALGLGDLVELPAETPGAESAFHLFVLLHPRRDEIAAHLERGGVEARAYYTTPMHRQPALARFAGGDEHPAAERLAAECLALPMGQCLERDQVATVVDAIRSGPAGEGATA